MNDIAVRVEGLGKRYRIGERERYRALRDVITDGVASPFRKLRSALSGNGHRGSVGSNGNGHLPTSDPRPLTSDLFWALKDVSFEVKRGEVVGIIGRNGAGKSTLLKILSRITAPTEGEVEIKGRVGSLLEVGTGFHPELTGRENIYLNGAILGMKRAEINRKFDEMVAFAEIEKFIDTPVKRYSSGMYVRLAFAVAAHLDPEILLVDEVLAVGDAQFQKKCLGKMGDVAKEGRTVLFVSHNMSAISRLCDCAIWLHQGRLHETGLSTSLIAKYLSDGLITRAERYWHLDQAVGDDSLKLRSLRVCQPSGLPCAAIDITQPFYIEIETQALERLVEVGVVLKILTGDGQLILETSDIMSSTQGAREEGHRLSTCKIPAYALNAGKYIVSVAADVPTVRLIFLADGVLTFSVENTLCPLMQRYGEGSWSGVLGPGVTSWTKRRLEVSSLVD